MIELRESIREIVVPAYVQAEAKPKPKTKPPVATSDDQLLGYGAPLEWLSDVRRADEDGLLALAEHVPAEAAEPFWNWPRAARRECCQRRRCRIRWRIPMRSGASGS
jgi:hypothetical protein